MAFTLASWNILATAYIREEFYPKTPPDILDPARRIPELVRHAAGLGVDILCLQEVEAEVFAALDQGLRPLGYVGSYARKGGDRPDGCATFFRRDRFAHSLDRRIAFADGNGGAASGHIAQLLCLEDEGKTIALVNTHLKWDPPGTPRQRQWGYRQISQVIETLRGDAAESRGQIVCGDFNVLPRSDVVSTLLDAGFEYAHRGTEARTFNGDGRPRLIDYVFHGSSLRARPAPTAPLGPESVLPSAEQPSDHLPLIARFDWAEPV
ncbi:MAG TPA: endonuclease/exonuclease/phosphatase family protein [Bryobacteraceae bacterium]|nr:endonuclease/exonuclease/phosphatase family protein [Bryobacteraceae bacterium]